MNDWIWRWWWIDPYLQASVMIAGVVGCAFSAYALVHTMRRQEHLRQLRLNGLRQSVLHVHLVTHTGIFLCQAILVLVSIGMMTLPAVPVGMYADHEGIRILTLLFLRKIARLVTSLVLLAVAVYKVRWLRWVAAQ